LGKKPAYLEQKRISATISNIDQHQTLKAIKNKDANMLGITSEYFSSVAGEIEKFRIRATADKNIDDLVFESIEQFLPTRNMILEIIRSLILYNPNESTWGLLHSFFENLIPYFYRPESIKQWNELEFDNFKFIIHELFLYTIAYILNMQKFDGAIYMLDNLYYDESPYSTNIGNVITFGGIHNYTQSFDYRNRRLELNQKSLRTNLIKERVDHNVKYTELQQADFVLFLRDSMDTIKNRTKSQNWWPETLSYVSYFAKPFKIFAKSKSKMYFHQIKPLLGIENKEDLSELLEKYQNGNLYSPKWDFGTLPVRLLLDIENIDSI